eukprot:Em0008g408a
MPKLMQAQKQELRKKSQETDKLHEGNTTTMLDYLKNYKLKILPSQRSEIWWKIQLQAKEAVADFFKGVGAVLCQVTDQTITGLVASSALKPLLDPEVTS